MNLKYNVKLPHDMSNLRRQMALKVEEFINSSGCSIDIDYIPSQFGAYASTFGVNTLSDMSSARKSKLTSTSSSRKTSMTATDLPVALDTLSLTQVPVPAAAAAPRNPDIYIPSEYGSSFGSSPCGVFTFSSSSASQSASSNTTDSKKN